MKDSFNHDQLGTLLSQLGELLQAQGKAGAIVVVGGAALSLRGVVSRATIDIDVIAVSPEGRPLPPDTLAVPTELPEVLQRAVDRMTRDLDLPTGWMNTTVTCGGTLRLPPGFVERVEWKEYQGLWVGIAGRIDLIALKLHAAVDTDVRSRHTNDLLPLRPTPEELTSAGEWVRRQDAGPEFQQLVSQVIAHVSANSH